MPNPDAVDEFLKYPILTEEIEDTSYQGVGSPLGAGGDNARTVSNAIRSILGWQPRREDTRGFLSALNQSFKPVEREGYTQWKWTPHSFSIDAGLGEVTGAQASLFQQAQVVLREVTPLLDNLKPLINDSDSEDISATLAIIRTTLDGIVNELGAVGGPVVTKVDDDFHTLVNFDPAGPTDLDPETVGGMIGELRDRLGLDPDRVNTIEEEQILTDFISLLNYVGVLVNSWQFQRVKFLAGSQVFLGTQLVKISRVFNVIAESVYQARFAFRSVFLGDAEQQTLTLTFNLQRITISELLDWIEESVTIKWPQMLRESGKDGAAAIVPTLERLIQIVAFAADLSKNPPAPGSGDPNEGLPAGFFTGRVQTVLDELHSGLVNARALARDINFTKPRPRQFSPLEAFEGESFQMAITGENFQDGVEVSLANAQVTIPARQVIFISPEQILADFALGFDTEGTYDIVILNPDGGRALLTPFVVHDVGVSSRRGGGSGGSGGGSDPNPTPPDLVKRMEELVQLMREQEKRMNEAVLKAEKWASLAEDMVREAKKWDATPLAGSAATAQAQKQTRVKLTVRVPADTPSGDVGLVGNLSVLGGGYQDYDPGNPEQSFLPMQPVKGRKNHYEVELDVPKGTQLTYHYAVRLSDPTSDPRVRFSTEEYTLTVDEGDPAEVKEQRHQVDAWQ